MTPKQAQTILDALGNLSVADIQAAIDEYYSPEAAKTDQKRFPKQNIPESYASIRAKDAAKIVEAIPDLLAHQNSWYNAGRVVQKPLVEACRRKGISLMSSDFEEVVSMRPDEAHPHQECMWLDLGKIKAVAAQARAGGREV